MIVKNTRELIELVGLNNTFEVINGNWIGIIIKLSNGNYLLRTGYDKRTNTAKRDIIVHDYTNCEFEIDKTKHNHTITNGDMFLKTFLNSKIESKSNNMITVFVSNMYLSVDFDKDWWNAPYKEEENGK